MDHQGILSGHSSRLQEIFDIHNKAHHRPFAKAEGPLAGAGPGPPLMAPGQGIGFNLIGFASANLGHGWRSATPPPSWNAPGILGVLDIDPGNNRNRPRSLLRAHFLPAGPPLPHPSTCSISIRPRWKACSADSARPGGNPRPLQTPA